MRTSRTTRYLGPALTIDADTLSDFDDGTHVIERKWDGTWSLATIEDGCIASLESRTGKPHRGVKEMIGHRVFEDGRSIELIGELVKSDDGHHLHLFDLGGAGPLHERRSRLEEIYADVISPRIHLVAQAATGFTAFFADVLGDGGEGVVIKARDGIYAGDSRGNTKEWIRCKPIRTVDYVAMGSHHGWVKLGLYISGRLRRVLSCQTTVGLPEVGDVVEVTGNDLHRSGAIRNPRITRIRDDKLATDCTLEAARRSIPARVIAPEVEYSYPKGYISPETREQLTEVALGIRLLGLKVRGGIPTAMEIVRAIEVAGKRFDGWQFLILIDEGIQRYVSDYSGPVVYQQ